MLKLKSKSKLSDWLRLLHYLLRLFFHLNFFHVSLQYNHLEKNFALHFFVFKQFHGIRACPWLLAKIKKHPRWIVRNQLFKPKNILKIDLLNKVQFRFAPNLVLKSDSHLPKKFLLICFNENPFRSQDIQTFVLIFWSCRKNSLVRKIRLISKLLTSQPG